MRAPFAIVNLDSGETANLESLYANQSVALVFLRHFGCVFCREQLASLREFTTQNIVLIALGNQAETLDFKRRMEIPQRMISDPTKALFQQFGLRRATLGQFITPQVISRGIQATLAGHRQGIIPRADPFMLAGVFIINQSGEIVFERLSRDPTDNMLGHEIAEKLATAS